MIEVQELECGYGRRMVVKGACLKARKGECVGIVGANGCGKSTLLSAVAGVKKIRRGTLLLDGHSALKDRKIFARTVGYVPQDNPLAPELSVRDNLRFWYGGRDLEKKLGEGLLEALDIGGILKTPVSKLSGGMKRRVSLACAAAGNPPILILDEPAAAVDMVCKQAVRDYLGAYLGQGGTVLMTSHEESELDLCGRLYVMKEGRLDEVDAGLRGHGLTELF